MRSSSCEASAIRDWRCTRPARCRHGCGRSTARRILWANPVGARLFGAANAAELAKRTFGPADPHRRQVAQLAGRLPGSGATRLERLRGFGAPLGALLTCGCARLEFADGAHGILVAAVRPVGRAMPLVERLQCLVEGVDLPIAAFARDGMFVGASDAARPLLGFRNLSEAGLDAARSDALELGRVETPVGIGHMVLQRVGSGADVALVALMEPAAIAAADVGTQAASQPVAPAADLPAPDYEQAASFGEAPAEFALIDDFAEPPGTAADTPAAASFDLQAVLQFALSQAHAIGAALMAEPPAPEVHRDEPSPVAEAATEHPAATVEAAPATPAAASVVIPPAPPFQPDEPPPAPRDLPLRFMWQMDAEGRFSLGSDEFTRLIGAHTAAGFGRPWSEVAETFGMDPEGRVAKAVASGSTWSGITLDWPVDGGAGCRSN